jgi:tagaturonate epimerase
MKLQELLEMQNSKELHTRLNPVVPGEVYERSLCAIDGGLLFMSIEGSVKRLHQICGEECCCGAKVCIEGAEEKVDLDGDTLTLRTGELSHVNAEALRTLLPWTKPVCLGRATSLGLGDRLGLATPGHVRAVRGTGIRPILAQQSIREMTRTDRTPEEVMDCAAFGVLQEGFDEGFGSDADHLKSPEDIDTCLKAGFTLYTVDPGDHVLNEADEMDAGALEAAYKALPWEALKSSPEATREAYAGKTFDVGDGIAVEFSDEALLRAAAKYGKAVAHTAMMKNHLAAEAEKVGLDWEIEMSVDETDSDTSPVEHYYVASELKRLGVEPVSLAPRFIGDFEKGVDYQGDLARLEVDFAAHAAIARHLGGYKISIHSGSDKFTVYPIAAKLTKNVVHVKTAGTSYLEALRAIAKIDPALFREILAFARDNYETDKQSYHVSATHEKILKPDEVADDVLADALNHFDTRQAFHVTFGSVLTRKNDDGSYLFRDRFYKALEENEEVHYACLEEHLGKHASPFAS